MVKIDHSRKTANAYSIKLSGDRREYTAKTVEEIAEAVKHYYIKPHENQYVHYAILIGLENGIRDKQ